MTLTCVTAVLDAIKSGNRENLIRCVRSVAALKTEHEHLIYDGGSTDGTVELLRELEGCGKTPHLRVVSEPDTGIYNALNKGVRDARGEWFYVLGCDDYICAPDVLDQIVDSVDRNVCMFVSPVDWGFIGRTFSNATELNQALLGHLYCHQGVLVKTEIVRSYAGFDETFKMCADADLILKVHQSCRAIKYCSKIFAHYGGTGFSASDKNIYIEESKQIAQQHFHIEGKGNLRTLIMLVKYAVHKDFYIRNSARYSLQIWMRKHLRTPLYPLVVLTRRFRYGSHEANKASNGVCGL